MQPSADVDYFKMLMLPVAVLVVEEEKEILITSSKFKTTVHDSRCHYPIKISAPQNKCSAMK